MAPAGATEGDVDVGLAVRGVDDELVGALGDHEVVLEQPEDRLLLLNEMGNLADGDLTVQASVTEDVTGAIADSINFTIEELRTLVKGINSATDQAWKGQPVAECGALPSAVSDTDPSPNSPRCDSKPLSRSVADRPARKHASTYGPISHGHTVPWW